MTPEPAGAPRRARAAARDVRAAVRKSLEETDGPVLIACSGGPDSLALAAAAADLIKARTAPIGAVVVDHGLQRESAAVAENAAEQCRLLGLGPVVVERVEVRVTDQGIEAAARAARYAALDRVAVRLGCDAVLLGHTLDDQAETVLLGLARGSGLRSLGGMAERRGRFRRPLLGLTRQVTEAALAHWDLVPWQDPHNEDRNFRRVRVRRIVMPSLEEQLGPGVARALARTARLARQDADALDEWANSASGAVAATGWGVTALAGLPIAVRGRVLRAHLLAKGCPASRLTADHIQQVDRLITDWHGQGPISLPGPVIATRRYGKLLVRPDSGAGPRE